MFGTRFELDEEKILREDEYDLEEMYAKIEELATKRAGLTKIAKNHYEFQGKENAQAHLGILVFNCLGESEWFATFSTFFIFSILFILYSKFSLQMRVWG